MRFTRFFAAILTVVMLCAVPVNVSAYIVYFSENFENFDSIASKFTFYDEWYFHEHGGIYGYEDLKLIQSKYNNTGEFNYPRYTYLTYDASVTLTASDGDISDSDRFVNLVYCNDNLIYHGIADDRIMMSFSYDFQNDCFRLTEGWNKTDDESQIMQPVYIEIHDGGNEFYTLGISVEKDRIRCFYNDTKIFDYEDTEQKYLIAHDIESPFLFWQDGNFVHITNITVDRPGYLLEPSYYTGDANNDGKVNLSDVSLILKRIAKWRNLDINIYAADTDRDGKVTLSDASKILRWIPGGKMPQ